MSSGFYIPAPSARLKTFLRELASVAGIVTALGNFDHLPASVRTVLLAVSGWLQVVQHNAEAGGTGPTPGVGK